MHGFHQMAECHVQTFIFILVSSDGTVKYSAVTMFFHKKPAVTTVYKSITTSVNSTINLTPEHLIYARQNDGDPFKAMLVLMNF